MSDLLKVCGDCVFRPTWGDHTCMKFRENVSAFQAACRHYVQRNYNECSSCKHLARRGHPPPIFIEFWCSMSRPEYEGFTSTCSDYEKVDKWIPAS